MTTTQKSMTDLEIANLETNLEQAVKTANIRISQYGSSIDVLQIQNDKKLKPFYKQIQNNGDSINHTYLKVEGYNSILQHLNQLWFLKGLIVELETNLSNPDIESCLFNIDKLNKKLEEFSLSFEHPQEILIIGELQTKLESLSSDFEDKLDQVISEFIKYGADSVQFTNPIILNDFPFQYDELKSCLVNTKYSHKLDHKHKLDTQLLTNLIENDQKIGLNILQNEDESMVYQLSVSPSDKSFSGKLESTINIIKFVNSFDERSLISYISSRLSVYLRQLIFENINDIVSNDALKDKLSDLVKLSSHWNLGIYIDDLNELWIENMVNYYVDSIRKVFKTADFSKLETINGEEAINIVEEETKKPTKQVSRRSSKKSNDEWSEWNEDDDAWDQDIDLSFEDETKVEENDDDLIDESWDWNEDEDEVVESQKIVEKKVSKPASKNSTGNISEEKSNTSNSYKITSLPHSLSNIIREFHSSSQQLPENQQQAYLSKTTYLVTAILSLSSIKYQSRLLLFNDLNYINNLIGSSEISEFNQNQLNSYITSSEKEVDSIIGRIDFQELEGCDLSAFNKAFSEWKSNKFDGLGSDSHYNPAMTKFVLNEMASHLFKLIIDKINGMGDMSSDETVIISGILSNISEKFSDDYNTNKLVNMKRIMDNNLKSIMEFFFNGDLFDFETNELISLLEKIFMKSDLRDGYIKDIQDIRNGEFD